MNHCRDCNSDYDKPGTCNCFAPNAKPTRLVPNIPTIPYVPYPWYQPPVTPWWGTYYVTCGSATTAGDVEISGNTTTKTDVPFTFTVT